MPLVFQLDQESDLMCRYQSSASLPTSMMSVCVTVELPNAAVLFFQLLGVNVSVLTEALTHKKIIAKGEEVGLDTHSHCVISICLQSLPVCVMSALIVQ